MNLIKELYNEVREKTYESGRRALKKYGIPVLAAFAYASCDGGITPPVNRPPVVSAAIAPDNPYDDEGLRLTYTATDPDGDRLTIERTWYRNSNPVADLANLDDVPASRTEPNDNWRARVIASDGEKADTAFAEVTVRPIPTATINGRFVLYFDSSAASNQAVRLTYGPSGEIKYDTTDANGNFSMSFDTRSITNPNRPSEIFVYGDATPLEGRRFHDYRDSLQLSGSIGLGTLLMSNYYVSPGGRVALLRWKRMTGNDGTGANTLHECWQYPASLFINANDSLARNWPDTIRNVLDGSQGINITMGTTVTESNSMLQIGININYVTDTQGNRYNIQYEGTRPKLGTVTFQSNGANTRSVYHELVGHVVFCLLDEDWDIPDVSRNPESIMGSSQTITELDRNYFRLSRRFPFSYDVKRHLDTSTRF